MKKIDVTSIPLYSTKKKSEKQMSSLAESMGNLTFIFSEAFRYQGSNLALCNDIFSNKEFALSVKI